MVNIVAGPDPIEIGKQGENNARSVTFDVESWIEEYGSDGDIVLLHRRRGELTPYPVLVDVDGGSVIWAITSADTAIAGRGICELQYFVTMPDGKEVLVKSRSWQTMVEPSLTQPGETPAQQTEWVASIISAFQKAVSASVNGPRIADGYWHLWNVDTGMYENTGVRAEATGYSVPDGGIPLSDLSTEVTSALQKAESALQSFEEGDPTVPKWAKEESKPVYTAEEVGALPADAPLFSGNYDDLENRPTIPEAVTDEHINSLIDAKITPLESLADEILEVM